MPHRLYVPATSVIREIDYIDLRLKRLKGGDNLRMQLPVLKKG
jgi:hypothetical protein